MGIKDILLDLLFNELIIMNENIDLTQILKNCPKGWKLYSPIFGEIDFLKIHDNVYAIVATQGSHPASFTKEGFYYADTDGECLLFPSKDQRDWNKFTAPWYKKEKFDPKTLKPFDKVIVKTLNGEWTCAIFSHITNYGEDYQYDCCYMICKYCIPYNDDTKHLIGTTKDAPEYYNI